MNPYLEANLAVLDEMYDAIVEFVAPLDDDCLNWEPQPETNSIADLVTHIVGSVDSWLARALAESFQRDRDAEFHVRRGAADLAALLTAGRARYHTQIARLNDLDGGTPRHVNRLSSGRAVTISVAWCLQHAIIHAGEHWGQIQLTSQLYAGRPA